MFIMDGGVTGALEGVETDATQVGLRWHTGYKGDCHPNFIELKRSVDRPAYTGYGWFTFERSRSTSGFGDSGAYRMLHFITIPLLTR